MFSVWWACERVSAPYWLRRVGGYACYVYRSFFSFHAFFAVPLVLWGLSIVIQCMHTCWERVRKQALFLCGSAAGWWSSCARRWPYLNRIYFARLTRPHMQNSRTQIQLSVPLLCFIIIDVDWIRVVHGNLLVLICMDLKHSLFLTLMSTAGIVCQIFSYAWISV